MFLKHLTLINFKNYDNLEIDFSEKINCFIGKNGVGKTNILDSIFYLSFCKSYFNPIDTQNIKHGKDFFIIQGIYDINGEKEEIYCGVKKSHSKVFKRNKKEYERLSDHIGLLPLVIVSPNDQELILSGSEERRKYINFVISQYDKEYLVDVISYNKVLKQRNALLKHFHKNNFFDKDNLDIYTEQLIEIGDRIYKKRMKFTNELIPVFNEHYSFISGAKENVNLTYHSDLHETDGVELFNKSLEKDKLLQYTTKGIHKDDLIFTLDEYPIKKVGSQGQNKTFLIALKIAQYDFIKNRNETKPVLLLDDIFDKFDSERVEKIISLVADNKFGQIFITDTNQERVKRILSKKNISYNILLCANNTLINTNDEER